MDIATFRRERVRGPVYGNAPVELVDAHQTVVGQMEQLCTDNMLLTSEQCLELSEWANVLSMEIIDYNAPQNR